jgi:hypothetical protein
MKHAKRNTYGLEPLMTVRECAAAMGVSHGFVLYLERHAFRKLRAAGAKFLAIRGDGGLENSLGENEAQGTSQNVTRISEE